MKNSNEQTMIKDLTQGSVVKQLFAFTAPLFVANLLQAVYNIGGQIIVGAGISAISIGGNVLHLLTFLAMDFSSAGQVIIAQYVGAGCHDQVQKLIVTMLTFLLGTSLLISVFCYAIRISALNWLNTPTECSSTRDIT